MTDRALLEDLGRVVRSGFAKVDADLCLVANDVSLVKERVGMVEKRTAVLEDARSRTSDRVRGVSENDLKQEAVIADVIIKNQERDKRIEETHALALAASAELARQSSFMGVGKQGLQWLASKEGRNALAQIGAAIVVVYEGLRHAGVIK